MEAVFEYFVRKTAVVTLRMLNDIYCFHTCHINGFISKLLIYKDSQLQGNSFILLCSVCLSWKSGDEEGVFIYGNS